MLRVELIPEIAIAYQFVLLEQNHFASSRDKYWRDKIFREILNKYSYFNLLIGSILALSSSSFYSDESHQL